MDCPAPGRVGTPAEVLSDTEVDLEISFKDRDGVGQQVTLKCWISRTPRIHLVSTSAQRELTLALNEVRVELIRMVDEAKTRTEPRNNRALRHS